MTGDDLRARLRQADPAGSMAPASPDEIARLLETTVTTTITTESIAQKTMKQRRYALAAAALVLITAAGAGWAVTRGGEKETVRINAAPPIAAKCVEPSVERLTASADFVFAGTVTEVTDAVVSIEVSRVFHGAAAGRVQVAQTGETSEQLMGSGRFETGRDYLVASSAGTVMICGYSGEASTPGLRELYEQAYPR